MSFKIVITNNDDGKVIVNNDNVKAIIGAIVDDESSSQMCFCKCNSRQLTEAVISASKVVSKTKKEHPEIEMFSKFEELFEKFAEDKE